MSAAQIDMFSAEPSTDNTIVGLAVMLPEQFPRCSTCRHERRSQSWRDSHD